MKHFLILPLIMWITHCVGLAASGGPSLRFLAERAPGNLGEVVLSAGEKMSPPFTLTSDRLSPDVQAPARKCSLRMKGKPATLAEIVLPETGAAFVILLIPNPEGGYTPIVIPANDAGFKAGDVYLYNHAAKPVLGYVGSSKFILDPGQGKKLRPAGAREETYYDVGFGVREKEGDKVMRTVRWPVVTRSRAYVFFYEKPENGRIDYRAVDEFVSPVKTAGAP